jgi:hypothetical protein
MLRREGKNMASINRGAPAIGKVTSPTANRTWIGEAGI